MARADTGAGVRELIGRLGGFEVRRVALEATGRMHLAVFAALAERGIAVVVLNPYRARKFADALGRLAKTPTGSTPGFWRSPPSGWMSRPSRRPRPSGCGSRS